MPNAPSSIDLDYVALDLVPKPFITYTLASNHRSASVCTDALGFRQQYFTGDQPVDLRELRTRYDRCRVLLGGSAAFGFKASSDRATMATHLSTDEFPMVNLALPGAGTQQELAALLALLHLLPEIRDVVIFSGLNECVHAVWRPAAVFSQFGGTAVGATRQEPPEPAGKQGRYAEESIDGATAEDAVLPAEIADERLAMALDRVVNNLRIWRLLEDAAGVRVHYVLQPVAGWMAKPLSDQEQAEFEQNVAGFPFIRWFTRPVVYQQVRTEVEAGAAAAGIRFHDANEWLAEESRAMFVDVCHFHDDGQRVMAEHVRRHLDWHDG